MPRSAPDQHWLVKTLQVYFFGLYNAIFHPTDFVNNIIAVYDYSGFS
jgi:hypothetical protein